MRRGRKGFTLVEIMIVVAIIALLAAIAIPNLLRARINANESAAQSTLKGYATSCESYAASVGGYPTAETDLTNASPPYYPMAMNGVTKGGYTYDTTLATGGYTVAANAVSAQTGGFDYRVSTGGLIQRKTQSGGTWATW